MAIDGNIVGFVLICVVFCICGISWCRCSDNQDDYDTLRTPLPVCVTDPPVALPACVTEPPPVALPECVTEPPLHENVEEAPPCYREACRCPSYM